MSFSHLYFLRPTDSYVTIMPKKVWKNSFFLYTARHIQNINTCIDKEQTQRFVIHQTLHGRPEIEPFNLVTHFLTGDCPETSRSGKPDSDSVRENE